MNRAAASWALACVLICGTALPVMAQTLAPVQTVRPEARPADPDEASASPLAEQGQDDGFAPSTSRLPQTRPSAQQGLAMAMPFGGLFAERVTARPRVRGGTDLAARLSLRPDLRPAGLMARVRASEARAAAAAQAAADAEDASEARAEATRQTPARVAQTTVSRGRLCGIRGLYGDQLEPITGRIGGCGIEAPIRLREVDGVPLNQPATINCTAAAALQSWLQDTAIPAVGRRGGGLASLRVVASYACRTRNSQPGARLSEHALGNAIDIAAIGLRDGSSITVLQGWRDRQDGPILRAMHEGACGTFGTVLGPESDRFHQDHFHFDVAAYRSGAYCR